MNIQVCGYISTRFGELWEYSLFDLVEEATSSLREKIDIDMQCVDAIFFSNMLGGIIENNLHSAAKIAEILQIHVPVFRVESACASGGMAFHLAHSYIQAKRGKTVLVIGAEKMTDSTPEEITENLASAAAGEEQNSGLTFAGLYALMARSYLEQYKYSSEVLSHVSVKNHFHALDNPKAHFRRRISINDVMASPMVADPLRVLDCSPISDGAAAILLSCDKAIVNRCKTADILASEVATDSISLSKRKTLTTIEATKIASKKAFKNASISIGEIGVAEVHDCFSIAELLAMEDIGFWKKGEAGIRIQSYETQKGKGKTLVVNPSGGLKASGHPVGATGIKQIGEIYEQLTQQAGMRQISHSLHYGLAHNVGGSGGTAVITILGI